MPAVWTVERTPHPRFPFRIAIEQDGRTLLAVRAQSAWPGPGQQIFCMRERTLEADEPLEPLERVAIAHVGRVGRKLVVVLDRPTRKRCEFLTVTKTSARTGRPYEQIFFRTESGIRAHRSRTRVELREAPPAHTIAIDSKERYPWSFPEAALVRRPLAVGDYALLADGRTIAVVERKSYDNLLGDFGAIQALHHQLEDLGSCPVAALVIEAQYGDFLDPARLKGRWPATHAAHVLAELAALHPRLPLIFAGNRKLANAWCAQFFRACAADAASPQLDLVRETLARYEATARGDGAEGLIRAAAIEAAATGFALREIAARFPDVRAARVRRVIGRLEEEGVLRRSGRGPATRWQRAG
jgi:hypothetical protein